MMHPGVKVFGVEENIPHFVSLAVSDESIFGVCVSGSGGRSGTRSVKISSQDPVTCDPPLFPRAEVAMATPSVTAEVAMATPSV